MGGKTHFGRARGLGVREDGAAVKAGGRKQLKFSQMLRGRGQASETTGNVREPKTQGAGALVSFPHCPPLWAREKGGGRSRKQAWPPAPLRREGGAEGDLCPWGGARKCWACPGHKEAAVFT